MYSTQIMPYSAGISSEVRLWKVFFPPQTSFPLVLVACMKPTFKCVRVPGFSEEGTLSARINSAALLSTGFVRFLWSSLSHLSFSVMVIRGAKGRLTARELKALPWFGPQRKMRKKARLDFKSSLSASWLFEKNSSTAALFFPLSRVKRGESLFSNRL